MVKLPIGLALQAVCLGLMVACVGPKVEVETLTLHEPEVFADCGSTSLVDDPATTAAGMAFPAGVLLDAASGRWGGDVLVGDSSLDGSLEFHSEDAEVRLLSGEPPACRPAYEVSVVASLWVGDGLLDEVFSGSATAMDDGTVELVGAIPSSDVRGSLWVPAAAETDLLIVANYSDGQWVGSMAWTGGLAEEVATFAFDPTEPEE